MTDDASTILVVEDDDATRAYLADNLSADGYAVLAADCARDGWRLLETKFPDLVLVDVGLPDGSGLELMRELLAIRSIKGIALTGYGTESDVQQTREAGFAAHLTKPINVGDVEAVIQRLAP